MWDWNPGNMSPEIIHLAYMLYCIQVVWNFPYTWRTGVCQSRKDWRLWKVYFILHTYFRFCWMIEWSHIDFLGATKLDLCKDPWVTIELSKWCCIWDFGWFWYCVEKLHSSFPLGNCVPWDLNLRALSEANLFLSSTRVA